MIKKSLAVAVILLFIGMCVVPATAVTKTDNSFLKDEDEITTNPNYISHRSIIINGNNNIRTRKGVIGGTGTKDDPYMISGWKFDGSFQYKIDKIVNRFFFASLFVNLFFEYRESAITIKNTDKYIKISENYFFNWTEPSTSPKHRAIRLSNTKNITIENNIFEKCNEGISGGSQTRISNNIFNSIIGVRGTVINPGSGCVIENNIFDNCKGGIDVSSQTTIRNNTFNSSRGGIDTVFITGSGTVVENNIFQNCDDDYGIHFLYATNTTIRNNSLKNIGSSYTIIGHYGLVENNELDNCGLAIKVENSIVQKNLVKSSGVAIGVAGPNCIVSNNNLIGNSVGVGCYWPPSNDPIISSNIIRDNNWGIYCIKNSQPEVHYNNIFDNNIGLNYPGGAIIDAMNNWWGASNGPSGAGSGSGDPVSNDVIFSPWLTSPNPDAGR